MYRRILPAAVAMLLLGATPSVAQVNIEAFRGKAGLSGAARFSMSSDFGNVDVVRSDGAGRHQDEEEPSEQRGKARTCSSGGPHTQNASASGAAITPLRQVRG